MALKIDEKRRRSVKLDQTKRNFLMVFSGFIGSIIGIAISFPIIGFLFHPLRKKTVYGGEDFVKVGNINEIRTGSLQKVTVNSSKVDGWNRFDDIILGAIWLIRKDDASIVAMSTVCPHLGCSIDWNSERKQFVCPCHISVFDIEGNVVSGPAPRSMDTLETKVKDDEVFVKYRKLRIGTSKKAEV